MSAIGGDTNFTPGGQQSLQRGGQGQTHKEYKWHNSVSLPLEVQCGITRLELPADMRITSPEIPEDVYFTAHIVCNQIPMHESPLCTYFSYPDQDRNALIWDYILSFPLKIRDLSHDAILVLTAWTAEGKVFGGTTMRLFSKYGVLKSGKQKLVFYFGMRGDPNVVFTQNKTPGELYNKYAPWDYKFCTEKHMESYTSHQACIERAKVRAENKNEWLDRLTLQRMQAALNSKAQFSSLGNSAATQHRETAGFPSNNEQEEEFLDKWDCAPEEIDMETFCYLIVEMPMLQHPVLYEEKHYPSVSPHVPPSSQMDLLSAYIVGEDNDSSGSGALEFSLAGRPFNASFLTIVADWDMDEENLAEEMNGRLSYNVRRGAVDSSAKPNKAEKERIHKIVNSPGGHNMTIEELDLLHRFRYSLADDKKALIKFLYSVDWDAENEVAEVPTLLALWSKNAPIDVADALKLLSREKAFEHHFVREYAVSILRSASDDELLTFLLQLVQALRYEPSIDMSAPTNNTSVASAAAAMVGNAAAEPLASALAVDYALEQSIIGIDHLSLTASVTAGGNSIPSSSGAGSGVANAPTAVASQIRNLSGLSPLASFLIDRACASPMVANFLFWYLKVEIEDETAGALFQSIFDAFIVQLSMSGPQGKMLFRRLCALDEYIAKISQCQRDARDQGRRKDGKEQLLIKYLEERKLHVTPSGVDWVPMPLNPTIQLTGLIPSTAAMFASAIYPCVIEFIERIPEHYSNQADGVTLGMMSSRGSTHKIMFKSGDDLRQDQLVMQMISLMDRLLKKVNLDLKLLTYGILAVSQKDGIMEFIKDSMPVSAIVKNFNSITEYLKKFNPDHNGPYGMTATALDTFVKSCAGYCVITYILGVGDRHLDNIMITKSGQMVHIDFGFIFGQDPKPLPPPFRFTRSMAEAMGGEDSEHFARFKTYCCQSYNWLRKSANLILNLLSLMGDAGIQDISKRSDLPKVLMKVEERFRLDLTDEQAEQVFVGLISESLHSLAPKIMEVAHKIAVSLR